MGDAEFFEAFGFRWDRSAVPPVIPIRSIDRAVFRFHRMLPEFVWDASVLEGNPFTFPEVQTLLDGVSVWAERSPIKSRSSTSRRVPNGYWRW
ncbi:MAG: hypothetical protein ABIU95_13645 [Burkholderiales bacterium]